MKDIDMRATQILADHERVAGGAGPTLDSGGAAPTEAMANARAKRDDVAAALRIWLLSLPDADDALNLDAASDAWLAMRAMCGLAGKAEVAIDQAVRVSNAGQEMANASALMGSIERALSSFMDTEEPAAAPAIDDMRATGRQALAYMLEASALA